MPLAQLEYIYIYIYIKSVVIVVVVVYALCNIIFDLEKKKEKKESLMHKGLLYHVSS